MILTSGRRSRRRGIDGLPDSAAGWGVRSRFFSLTYPQHSEMDHSAEQIKIRIEAHTGVAQATSYPTKTLRCIAMAHHTPVGQVCHLECSQSGRGRSSSALRLGGVHVAGGPSHADGLPQQLHLRAPTKASGLQSQVTDSHPTIPSIAVHASPHIDAKLPLSAGGAEHASGKHIMGTRCDSGCDAAMFRWFSP